MPRDQDMTATMTTPLAGKPGQPGLTINSLRPLDSISAGYFATNSSGVLSYRSASDCSQDIFITITRQTHGDKFYPFL
jgi:hypothetical protein